MLNNIKNILKILSFMFLFFIFCHCAKTNLNGAEKIISNIRLIRTIGSDEAQVTLNFWPRPGLGSDFSVNNVVFANMPLAGFPLESKEYQGNCGGLDMTYLDFEGTIPLKIDKGELNVKINWHGENDQEIDQAFIVPPLFELESVSAELSSKKPLNIKLKNVISRSDYNFCGVDLNEYHTIEIFNNSDEKNITLSLSKIEEAFPRGDMPDILYVSIVCGKFVSDKNAVETPNRRSGLEYEVRTKKYPVRVLRN
jgi:hypothetical protein